MTAKWTSSPSSSSSPSRIQPSMVHLARKEMLEHDWISHIDSSLDASIDEPIRTQRALINLANMTIPETPARRLTAFIKGFLYSLLRVTACSTSFPRCGAATPSSGRRFAGQHSCFILTCRLKAYIQRTLSSSTDFRRLKETYLFILAT